MKTLARIPRSVAVFCLVLSGLAHGADEGPPSSPSALEAEIWRVGESQDRWDERCRAMGAGLAVSTEDLLRDARRLAEAVDGLEGRLARVGDDDREALGRKLAALRARGPHPGQADLAASCRRRASRTPTEHRGGSDAPRVMQAGTGCETATPIDLGTVMWSLPASRGRAPTELVRGDAWFRLDVSRDGRFEAHTRGSTADTEIAVYEHCAASAAPSVTDDDGLGLRSAVAFDVAAVQSRWIRVRQRAGRAIDPILLTVRGTVTGVTGIVTADSNGAPIESVRIEIRRRSDGDYEGADYTDANGAYQIEGLTAGTYVVHIDGADGYLRELWSDRPCYDGCDDTTGDPIEVVDGALTPGIDFALLRAGSISGRVRDAESGEAIAGHEVRLSDDEGGYGGGERTDVAGRYRFDGLDPDVYFAYTDDDSGYRNEVYDGFPCAGYCNDPLDGTPIQVLAEAVILDVDFALDRLGSISGRVVDAQSGEPLEYFDVDAFDATGSQVGSADADADGRYRIGGLPTGSYFVATDGYGTHRNEVYDALPCTGGGSGNCVPLSGASIAVTEGETTPGIDFTLDRLGSVVGEVTAEGAGASIPDVRVNLWDASGGFENSERTNAAGVYVIEGLAPGSYHATTSQERGYIDELYDDLDCLLVSAPGCDPTTGTPIAVALGAATPDIDFALTRGGVVTGRILDDFRGDPIDGEWVDLWISSGTLVGSARTDDLGHFRFEGLPTGSYRASSRTQGSHLDELYDALPCPGGAPGGCDPTTGSPIAVAVGATTSGIDLDLALAGGLSGRVTVASSGEPLPGVAIDVWNDQGESVGTAVTDSAGNYLVDTRSGSFYLSTDVGGDHVDQVYEAVSCFGGPAILGRCDPLLGTAVTVIGVEPAVTGIDFALGEVLFANGFESGSPCGWSQTVPWICD